MLTFAPCFHAVCSPILFVDGVSVHCWPSPVPTPLLIPWGRRYLRGRSLFAVTGWVLFYCPGDAPGPPSLTWAAVRCKEALKGPGVQDLCLGVSHSVSLRPPIYTVSARKPCFSIRDRRKWSFEDPAILFTLIAALNGLVTVLFVCLFFVLFFFSPSPLPPAHTPLLRWVVGGWKGVVLWVFCLLVCFCFAGL